MCHIHCSTSLDVPEIILPICQHTDRQFLISSFYEKPSLPGLRCPYAHIQQCLLLPVIAENTGGASSTPRSVANGMKSVALEEWAAISYLSQLSHCVAHILDINLPYTTYIQ